MPSIVERFDVKAEETSEIVEARLESAYRNIADKLSSIAGAVLLPNNTTAYDMASHGCIYQRKYNGITYLVSEYVHRTDTFVDAGTASVKNVRHFEVSIEYEQEEKFILAYGFEIEMTASHPDYMRLVVHSMD
jgi:cobalamin biosynthesis protein CobD/CbiB